MPTGTRKSTYANPEFLKAAKFADAEKKAIDSANPNDSTLPKSPYVGVQFAAIPEFQAIGIAVGQQMSAALAGKVTVDAALKTVAGRGRPRDEQGRLLQVSPATAAARRPGRRADPGSNRTCCHERLLPRLLMAPAVITLFLWMIVPLVMTLYFSPVRYNLMQPGDKDFIGLANFELLLHRPGLRAPSVSTRCCCCRR